jgi:hypothetical protein
MGAISCVLFARLGPVWGSDRAAATPQQLQFFETQVRPILQSQCLKCHGGEKTKGGLQMTSRQTLLNGGDSGPVVDLANPSKSLLLVAISYKNEELQMPPKQRLHAEQVAILTKWVEMGVPWSGVDSVAAPVASHEGTKAKADPTKHWSFQPITRPAVPRVQNRPWVKTPIDAFVAQKLETHGFAPAAPADKLALLRRACFDLTGLPPKPHEVHAFLSDSSANAFEKVVDRLLASPQYGEKWGRHWLDVVRFAETNSFERDAVKPNAWRYRDYVIESFNQDKPFDQFLREQLAGDELDQPTPESIIATGFYRLGAWDDEPTDKVQARYDELDDIVTTVSQGMLGLTMNCARCHDHKIDPIPQKDYYRLLAFFQNITPYTTSGPSVMTPIAPADQVRAFEEEGRSIEQRKEDLKKRIEHFEKLAENQLTDAEKEKAKNSRRREEIFAPKVLAATNEDELRRYRDLWSQLRELEARKKADLPQALSVKETGPDPAPTHVHVRGNANLKGDPVEPGFPQVLKPPAPNFAKAKSGQKTTQRRRALADWVTSKDNPLTPRVAVNRLWQHHFGRGIVRSSNDFGLGGDRPTHPELLDWLASELVARGWRLKEMHKLIMMSSAYQMSSSPNAAALAKDPQNDLLWRFDMRRLTAEEIRDSILAVNGNLNPKMGGPGVYPTIPDAILQGQSVPGQGWGKSGPQDMNRRSVYIHVKRSLPLPALVAFDSADTDFSCPARFTTTQSTQALLMLNSDWINDEAKALAGRLKREAGDDPTAQVRLAFALAISREPRQDEVERGVTFINRLVEKHQVTKDVALEQFALLVLNLNEFVYLD